MEPSGAGALLGTLPGLFRPTTQPTCTKSCNLHGPSIGTLNGDPSIRLIYSIKPKGSYFRTLEGKGVY